MKCQEIQDLFGEYWDLTDDDIRKLKVDGHVKHCRTCAAEYNFWRESRELIQTASIKSEYSAPKKERMSDRVMSRIYTDESWRVPVQNRVYSISYKMRRNLTAVLAFFFTLFIFSFIYTLIPEPNTGIMPVASASGDASAVLQTQSVPVASITDPIVLRMVPVQTNPDYLLVVSILGIVCALMTLNWLSKIRA
jgi:hypothetical protein